jgi:hypothetical protein
MSDVKTDREAVERLAAKAEQSQPDMATHINGALTKFVEVRQDDLRALLARAEAAEAEREHWHTIYRRVAALIPAGVNEDGAGGLVGAVSALVTKLEMSQAATGGERVLRQRAEAERDAAVQAAALSEAERLAALSIAREANDKAKMAATLQDERDAARAECQTWLAHIRALDLQLTEARAEAARMRALLRRYRTETPLGHQPHMIAAEADGRARRAAGGRGVSARGCIEAALREAQERRLGYIETSKLALAALRAAPTDVRLALARDLAPEGWQVVETRTIDRAQTLVSLLTVRQVIQAGDSAIDAAGLNPWCINEGRADGSARISAWWLAAAPGAGEDSNG